MALAFVNIEINRINFDFKEQVRVIFFRLAFVYIFFKFEVVCKMETSLKNLLKKISDLTCLDIKVPSKSQPLVYNYCIIFENKKSKNCFTKVNYKFISYNPDDSVLIEPVNKSSSDVQYETIKGLNQTDTSGMSADYAVLSRVTNQFVQSISENFFINSKDEILSSTTVDQEYDLLCDCYSDKLDGTIIKNNTLTENGGSMQSLVSAPFRRRKILNKSNTDVNNNVETSNLSDSRLEKWLKNLNCSVEESRSMPLLGFDQNNESDDESSMRLKKNSPDDNVFLLRNAVFNYINESLQEILNSVTKLENFRKNVALVVADNEKSSIEDFTQDIFDLFSNTVFHKIVKNVRLEWSNRLRS